MWWLTVSISILLILMYVLFAPLIIEVNSIAGVYRVRFHRMASGSFTFRESSVFLNVKIMGWQKEFDLLEKKQKKEKPVTREQPGKKIVPFRMLRARIKGLMKSFRLEECYITMDTGNMPWNGILYPWFYLLSRRAGRNVTINFWGENTVVLKIQNTLARIVWAFIKS